MTGNSLAIRLLDVRHSALRGRMPDVICGLECLISEAFAEEESPEPNPQPSKYAPLSDANRERLAGLLDTAMARLMGQPGTTNAMIPLEMARQALIASAVEEKPSSPEPSLKAILGDIVTVLGVAPLEDPDYSGYRAWLRLKAAHAALKEPSP